MTAVGSAGGLSSSSSSSSSSSAAAARAKTVKKPKASRSKEGGHEQALKALHAHFADTFDVAQPIKPVSSSSKTPPRKSAKKKRKQPASGEERSPGEKSIHAASKYGNFSAAGPSRQGAVTIANDKAATSSRRAPETVVFGGNNASMAADRTPGWRKFMSSKVEKVGKEEVQSKKRASAENDKDGVDGSDNEASNADDEVKNLTNDRALSELLSTTLFAPGAQEVRRANGKQKLGSNETMARLLELGKPTLTSHAASVGRGLGAATLKAQQMNRMPATMRHGMRAAEQFRAERDVQRQKELGNYHHSIKDLVGGRSRQGMDLIMGETDKTRQKRTRQKGLSMGLGSFQNGALRIKQGDVARINDSGRRSAGKGAGGGGGGGGGSHKKRRT